MVDLQDDPPISSGSRSLKRSHYLRPSSVFFQLRNTKIEPDDEGKMMYHRARSRFGRLTTNCVSAGSSPPSCAKMFTKTGTRKSSSRSARATRRQDHRRVDHRALDAALDLRLLLDLERDAVEHLVQDPAASPASTIATNRRSKTFGWRPIASRAGAALDVGAQLPMTSAKYMSSVCSSRIDERRHDVETGLDHRRELAREDLKGLRLDLLEDVARAARRPRKSAPRGGSPAGRGAELLARAGEVRAHGARRTARGPSALMAE